ncbi:MAG: M23 family metallopeptidase [Clostridia bacterium]|nr:M23 family metallopeptidase [Clostridia bacterium]
MMKRRVQRLSWFQRYKKYIYIGGGAVTLGVLSFAITVFTLGRKVPEAEISEGPITINEYAYRTDESSIRINPESLRRSEAEEEPASSEEKEEAPAENMESVVASKPEEVETVEVSAPPVKEEPVKKEVTFILPVDGEIILEYAKDKLVYSKTLEEWITHTGIDIQGEEAMPVKAAADGKVKDKKVDPRYGNTIIIEHDDGYKTIYSNLSSLDLVEVNQEVKQGEIISGVGSGYGFEVEEGPHIHFEIMRDGININPSEKM